MVGGAEGAVSGRGWDGSGQGDIDAARRIAWSIKCQENPSRLATFAQGLNWAR